MNLSKSDALFLHSLLFHALTKDLGGEDVVSRVQDIMENIESHLLGEHAAEEEADVEEDVEEEVEEEVDHYVLANDLHDLPEIVVNRTDGTSVKIEFELCDDSVDLLLDGEAVLENVDHINVTGNNIRVYSDEAEEVHHFTVKRLPKKWKQVLQEGLSEVAYADEEDE